jgi:hypothetical protein
VQVGEDAGIIYGAGLRQDGRDAERLAQHVHAVGFLEAELGSNVSPDENFVVGQGLDDPLAGQCFLVFRPHHADRGPATNRPREDAGTAPGGLGLELALGQDAREREGLAL